MANSKGSILIAEDEESVRISLEEMFRALGYHARSAEDGIAALIAIRQEIPDILLSDLQMPVMSGFELLSVVRRRFPRIHLVAMSGMFTEDDIPYGVAADALYQKGNGVAALLTAIERRHSPRPDHHGETPDPVWVQKNGHDARGEEFITIACPECLRAFPQTISGKPNLILETRCQFCHSVIFYGVVNPNSWVIPHRLDPTPHFVTAGKSAAQRSD